MRHVLIVLIRMYQRYVSPWTPAVCRFQPTCSEYAAIAYRAYGPLRGTALAVWRILRCHPMSRGGFDPVPGTGFDSPTETCGQGPVT